MLDTLKIRNLAVIDSAEIPFKSGLNILSGETGAGKSIVLEAIALILGSRATSSLIRTECDEAVVEGLFDLTGLPEFHERLSRLGLPQGDDQQLLIKRTVHHAGKHRITINGELATLGNLQALCEGLVDLCSQHEHQSLLRPATQIDLIDRHGKLEELRSSYAEVFHQVRNLKSESEKLSQDESARLKRLDYLKFQIDELRSAQLRPGEEAELQQEKTLQQSAQSRLLALEQLRTLLEEGEDGNALQLLQLAIQKITDLAHLDERVAPLQGALERALAEVEDTSLSLHRYSKSVDLDPERLDVVLERLGMIADLRRKYGEDTTRMLETLERLELEFQSLSGSGQRLEQIEVELQERTAQLVKLAAQLSSGRTKTAAKLAQAVSTELRELNMPDAEFSISIDHHGKDFARFTALGADDIQFLVRTNRGEAAQALGKIASGGELSRLMLAVRRVISGRGGIGVYLFDEIDAGMGGQTAFQVGRKLKSVAAHNQVICITHLPQVASFADHHLVVRKGVRGKRTITEVQELTLRDRKEELARMLGGAALTKRSLENAAELLEMAAG